MKTINGNVFSTPNAILNIELKYKMCWNKEHKQFVTEASDYSEELPFGFPGMCVQLKNPTTKGTKDFYFIQEDRTPCGDVGGWNYKSSDNYNLLIIND